MATLPFVCPRFAYVLQVFLPTLHAFCLLLAYFFHAFHLRFAHVLPTSCLGTFYLLHYALPTFCTRFACGSPASGPA